MARREADSSNRPEGRPRRRVLGRAERLDFEEYLDFLTERGHNFICLWRWEHFRSQAAGGALHLTPAPDQFGGANPSTPTTT